jgi:hypothetical protein
MQDTRYFIRDCEGRVIGNPKGYDTFKGANRQANHGKANRQAWNHYAVRSKPENCRVWSIKAEVL